MVLLHLRLTEQEQQLDIPHDIKAQVVVLRKIVVQKDTSAGNLLGGGICLDLNAMTNSFEIMTSEHNGYLTVPLLDGSALTNHEFHIKFSAEQIKSQFRMKTFKYDGVEKAVFGSGNGHIDSIDIYFEYETNDHHHG